MSIAKKAGTSASVTTGHILSSLPTPEETPSHPRRTANPKRRLEQRNGNGGEGVGEDLTGERRDMSPIPQLDGGGGETYDKDDNSNAWMDDFLEQFKDRMDRSFERMIKKEEDKVTEISEALQKLNSALSHANSHEKQSIPTQNEDMEDESVTFEDVKNWALSQKKLN